MALDFAIAVISGLVLAAMFHPGLRRAPRWRAMITPLASIIGSGFLVLGPVLEVRFGALAPVAMAGLCLAGWLFGAAIRANIAAEGAPRSPLSLRLERTGEVVLAAAYVISVTYYLNLFGAFAVSLTPWPGEVPARIVTTAALALVALAGWAGGFGALERMEYTSVALKLAIIGALLVALAVHFARQAAGPGLIVTPPTVGPVQALQLGFGLIVTVQGFETARYLGASYDAPTRIAAMKQAQWMSALIYMLYICFLAFLFAPDASRLSETAIIDMMRVVAPVLPAMLVAAALAAQFSAAVADTGGAGGLVAELTRGRIGARQAYLGLVGSAIIMTWRLDIFAIIAQASRAFALYYAVQAAVAALQGRGVRHAGWWALAAFGLAVAIFGVPAEG